MAALLGRIEVEASDLWRAHPPSIHNAQKVVLFELAGGAARTPRGSLQVTRWAAETEDPRAVRSLPKVTSADGPFSYPEPEPGVDAWHVNFADPELFAFYAGPAFAQDEIQVAEHPVLASLRGLLVEHATMPARTWAPEGPTPVLVRDVERWCAIDTDPELARPYGIYGRKLQRASREALEQAVRRIEGAHRTNLIAMAAPQGRGHYSVEDVRDVMETAVTAFQAARIESARAAPGARVRVHTGHWGTGAFGGDRVLMAAAQVLAASIAGIEEIAYNSLDDDGVRAFEKGGELAGGFRTGETLADVIRGLHARGFTWGSSDGN